MTKPQKKGPTKAQRRLEWRIKWYETMDEETRNRRAYRKPGTGKAGRG